MLNLNILIQKFRELSDELRMCSIGYWETCLLCKAHIVMEYTGKSELRPKNEYFDTANI